MANRANAAGVTWTMICGQLAYQLVSLELEHGGVYETSEALGGFPLGLGMIAWGELIHSAWPLPNLLP